MVQGNKLNCPIYFVSNTNELIKQIKALSRRMGYEPIANTMLSKSSFNKILNYDTPL